MIDFSIIGRRIKAERKRRGLTQQDMAEILNISVPYMSRIETGKATLNLVRLSEISEILDIDIGVLLTGSSNASGNYLIPELSDLLADRTSEELSLAYRILREIFKQDQEEDS